VEIIVGIVDEEGKQEILRQKIDVEHLEEGVLVAERQLGVTVMKVIMEKEDEALAKGKPKGWQSLGREKRVVVTEVGRVEINRRVYRDENGKRRKPLDEKLQLRQYERLTWGMKVLASELASETSYRKAAVELSWLIGAMIGTINRSQVKKAVWQVGEELEQREREEQERIFKRGGEVKGGEIKCEMLYGEADGVYVNLQREKKRKAEVRVGVMYTGKKAIGKDRHGLENKISITGMPEKSEEWQEELLRAAWSTFDLSSVKQLIVGGDGAGWVKGSFARLEIETIYQLDRFHLCRAIREGLALKKEEAEAWLRRCEEEGFEGIKGELIARIEQEHGARKEKARRLYGYLAANEEGLIDYRQRLKLDKKSHSGLGTIEGYVDKLVAHRLKGRGMSWRKEGLRAMLALRRHRNELEHLCWQSPLLQPEGQTVVKTRRKEDNGEWLQASIPILQSISGRPWVENLHSRINQDADFSIS